MRIVCLLSALLVGIASLSARASVAGFDDLVTSPAEQARQERFATQWFGFLRDSLSAADERQRLVAAHMLLAGGSLGGTGRFDLVPSSADLARAMAVRDAVRERSTDPITLSIAASHCRAILIDAACSRVELLERAVTADPANGWTWLALGGAVHREDPARARLAFARALQAPVMRESPWLQTFAALYVPLRHGYPAVDADLALFQLMGMAAAGVDGTGWFLIQECSPTAVSDAARATECRRLVEAIGDSASIAISLSLANSMGMRLGVQPATLTRWKERLETARQAQTRLPFSPQQGGRAFVATYGDDLVRVGEFEASRRLMQRLPLSDDARGLPDDKKIESLLAGVTTQFKLRLDALLAANDAFSLLMTQAVTDEGRAPLLSPSRQAMLRQALAATRDPVLLTLAGLHCASAAAACSVGDVAQRWIEVEPDNAAAWLFLVHVQLRGKEEGAARSTLLRAAAASRYDGHTAARLRAGVERLRALTPAASATSVFSGATLLTSWRARFGESALTRLCQPAADADLRAACLSIARRIEVDAATTSERLMALDARRRLGERVSQSEARVAMRDELAAQALGATDAGWRPPAFADPATTDQVGQQIVDALLAHGELGAARRLVPDAVPKR
jgi:hypothetical protein